MVISLWIVFLFCAVVTVESSDETVCIASTSTKYSGSHETIIAGGSCTGTQFTSSIC